MAEEPQQLLLLTIGHQTLMVAEKLQVQIVQAPLVLQLLILTGEQLVLQQPVKVLLQLPQATEEITHLLIQGLQQQKGLHIQDHQLPPAAVKELPNQEQQVPLIPVHVRRLLMRGHQAVSPQDQHIQELPQETQVRSLQQALPVLRPHGQAQVVPILIAGRVPQAHHHGQVQAIAIPVQAAQAPAGVTQLRAAQVQAGVIQLQAAAVQLQAEVTQLQAAALVQAEATRLQAAVQDQAGVLQHQAAQVRVRVVRVVPVQVQVQAQAPAAVEGKL